ncbi:TPA: hypothetical protein QCR61_005627, partial [Bacillus cereus]|nr:hypothetical protein [Bacillus cereus]
MVEKNENKELEIKKKKVLEDLQNDSQQLRDLQKNLMQPTKDLFQSAVDN